MLIIFTLFSNVPIIIDISHRTKTRAHSIPISFHWNNIRFQNRPNRSNRGGALLNCPLRLHPPASSTLLSWIQFVGKGLSFACENFVIYWCMFVCVLGLYVGLYGRDIWDKATCRAPSKFYDTSTCVQMESRYDIWIIDIRTYICILASSYPDTITLHVSWRMKIYLRWY